jgi:hypothetical protein
VLPKWRTTPAAYLFPHFSARFSLRRWLSGCRGISRFRWYIASFAIAGGHASDIIVCSENG